MKNIPLDQILEARLAELDALFTHNPQDVRIRQLEGEVRSLRGRLGVRKMKFGVIGCGKVAKNHINAYLGLNLHGQTAEEPQNDVLAIADISEDRVEETCRNYEANKYTIPYRFSGADAHQRVLEMDLDGISICVPPLEDKVNIILDALRARKNLLVEKPLTSDLESAKRISEVWDGKTVFAMSYNWRNTFVINKLKEYIQSEQYGKLEHLSVVHCEPWNYHDPDSFYTKLGYLFEHNVHDVNYLRYLAGEIRELEAVAYGEMPNPSSFTVNFNCENGAKGLFQSMNGTRNTSFYIHAAFEKGSVVGMFSEKNPDFEWSEVPYFRIFTPEGEIFSEPLFPIGDQDIIDRKISWVRVNQQGAQAGLLHPAIINDFISAIDGKSQPKSNAIDGYRDIKVLYAIRRSIEERGKVIVD
jgi:predicted dehydrogenase